MPYRGDSYGEAPSRLTFFGIGGAVLAFVLLVLFLIFKPFVIVDSGTRGVVTRLGAVQPTVLDEGFHWYNSLTETVHEVNIQTKAISFDGNEPLNAASKDLQEVRIAVIVNYHPDPSKVNTIFQQFGKEYETKVVSPIVREVVKNSSAKFTAEELITRRADFVALVNSNLVERFSEKMMVYERSNIVNIDFADSFNKAIEAKVTAEQEALAEKNKLEKVKAQAQQQIETAKAQAETIRIQAEAVNKQGGADYVKLKAIEKWDGRLPQYQLGQGAVTPFVDLGSLK